ncbi:MAG TPA: HD domain-containing phosphohydrolase, partial [Ktedonobacteraceae bacterium]|nr:HD domain-containing phosphohydrolase [Ktedonobacteraceae bacterium]
IGQRILLAAGSIFSDLAPIVLAHHERWDGLGYPNGLAGEDIPLLARILAVVDSYDAMVSERAYSAPKSIAEARAELERCAGSQYDPRVVAAFLAVLDEQNVQVATCTSALSLFTFTAQDLFQHVVNPLCEVLPAPSSTKKLVNDDLRQNPVGDVPELVDEVFATPSLQSA